MVTVDLAQGPYSSTSNPFILYSNIWIQQALAMRFLLNPNTNSAD